MGIVRGRVISLVVVLFASACGFPRPADVGPDDAQPNGPGYRLLAVTPANANTGDTVFLDGTFADSATVQFPGGATQAATILGPHRATVVVPDAATAGDLTVTTGGVTIGPVAFRRMPFALGLQPFRIAYEQTGGGRQSSILRIARSTATAVVIKNWLYVIGGVDSGGGALNSIERAAINADGTVDGFELIGDIALTQARSGHTNIVVGNSLYIIGGAGGGGATSSVERSAINADGSLGNFAAVPAAALTTARSGHTISIIGDAVYAMGGARSGGAKLAGIERATIQPDGSLGAFRGIDTNLTQPRSGHTAEVVGDALYVVGGDSGSGPIGSVERAVIRGDGSLGPFEVTGSVLTSPRSDHGSAVIGGALYVIGGSTSAGISRNVERAPIDASGGLGPFAAVSTTTLSAVRSGPAIASVGNMLYAIGGRGLSGPLASTEHASRNADSALTPFVTSGVALVLPRIHDTSTTIRNAVYVIGASDGTSSVERGELLLDGSLTVFTTVPGAALATDRSSHAIARIGRYLYVVAGSAPSPLASVERAAIKADGSLDNFAAVSAALVQARLGASCVVIGNALYVISGIGLDHSRLTSIERSVISSDGTLGAFEIVSGVTLNTGRNYFTTLVTDSSLYVIGGLDDATGGTSSIERAAINADGTLSTFAPVSNLLFSRGTHASVVVGNTVYVVGGLISGELVPDTERATINLDGTTTAFSVAAGLNLAEVRARHTAAAVANHAYLLGGVTMRSDGATEAVLAIERANAR